MGEPEYYDEVYEASGEPRPRYRAAIEALGAADLAALGEDSTVVNMAQGGGVKATWTVAG